MRALHWTETHTHTKAVPFMGVKLGLSPYGNQTQRKQLNTTLTKYLDEKDLCKKTMATGTVTVCDIPLALSGDGQNVAEIRIAGNI